MWNFIFKILTNTIMKKMLKYPKLVGWNFNLDPRSGETKRTFLLSNNTKSVVLFEFWNSIWNFENNPTTWMGHDIPLNCQQIKWEQAFGLLLF